MTVLPPGSLGVTVSGQGEARGPESGRFDSKQRQAVRYADPAAWTVAAAVDCAVAGAKDEIAVALQDAAIIVISDEGPQETMASIVEAWKAGYSSPLRYPAANPGSLAGVPSILLGFRGPTLNLATRPKLAVPVGLLVAANWLHRRAARYVALAAFGRPSPDALLARCQLLQLSAGADKTPGKLQSDHQLEPNAAWLSAVSD